ncbi:MAG: hypothetical protein QXD15_06460, partial [Thermoplasmata archaeon]
EKEIQDKRRAGGYPEVPESKKEKRFYNSPYNGNAMLEPMAGSGLHCDYTIAYASTKVDVSR